MKSQAFFEINFNGKIRGDWLFGKIYVKNSDKYDTMSIQNFLYIIGHNIKRLRGSVSQDELAKKAGVSRSTIQAIERGKSVGLDKILKIAEALDINPADLFLTEEDRSEVTYKAKLFWEKLLKGG